MEAKLILLWREMSDLTAPECAHSCRTPHSCCSPEYCDMAQEIALDEGVILIPTGHPKLKFMGQTGCIVEPYLRPLCTLHTCAVSGAGFKVGDTAWNEKYFALRNQLEDGFD